MSQLALSPDRDFIGYGADPPTFEWPTGRVALSIVVEVDEGAERSRQLMAISLARRRTQGVLPKARSVRGHAGNGKLMRTTREG